MSGRRYKIVLFSLLLTVAAQSVRAESVGQVVNEGNKLYRQGRFKDAMDKYERALTESPEVIEPRFNKADSYFRLDDLPQAIDLYKAVAAESKDMQMVEKAKYNLGNSFFRQGTKLAASDAQKALENMQTAIGYWRQVLDIDPANQNAAKNIEVARLTIKDIKDQIEKQKQQQQKQEQQQKQTKDDLRQLLEQQKSLANKTQQTKQQADNNSISQQQAGQDYNDIAKQQSDLKDKTQKTLEQLQKQNDANSPDQQKAAEQLEQAVENQKEAEKKLNDSQASDAKRSQDKAAEDIEKALKDLTGKQDQNQQQQQQPQQQNKQQPPQQEPNQPQEPNQAQQQQDKEAAPDATAEEILDRERRQWQDRQLLQSPGFQKVDKDW